METGAVALSRMGAVALSRSTGAADSAREVVQSAGTCFGVEVNRDTSLIRNSPPLGPYSRTKPRALWWS